MTAHSIDNEASAAGAQAKRTNIGIALITKPQVLFLDEPTSGLDSYTAHEVCPSLEHSFTVMCTEYRLSLSLK